MYTAWMVVSFILLVIWLVVAVLSVGVLITDAGTKREFQVVSANLALAMLFVLFHWIILLIAIPLFVIYGLYQAVKLLLKKEEA